MNLALAVFAATLLVAGLAVLGGADFGTGAWDLTAGRGTRAARMRALLHSSMGPVWEANREILNMFFWSQRGRNSCHWRADCDAFCAR